MSAALRASDMLGRWGGDEFVVVGLVTQSASDDPQRVVDEMRSRLALPLIGTYTSDECSFDYRGASFGIVSVDPAVSSLQAALKEADRLMYADKQARRAQQTAQGWAGV
ncbi:hypothetical protein G6F22_021670 [Rhizopus arrhizus]|nr:hypothetical protein G6F22_021670 [Rhizopus arrhizus]